jgi:hypothetical protein
MRRTYQRTLILFSSFVVLSSVALPVLADSELPLPRLFPPDARSQAISVRAHGTDPAGPQRLELWVWRTESFERIASQRSSPGGLFDFGEIPVPQQGLSLAVTIQGNRPSLERVVRFENPVPAPKIVPSLDETSMELIVHPARYEGELRIRNAMTGTLVARRPIDSTREGTSVIDLFDLIGSNPPSEIRVQQVLEDGRVSASSFYRFESRALRD